MSSNSTPGMPSRRALPMMSMRDEPATSSGTLQPAPSFPLARNRARSLKGTKRSTRETQGKPGPTSTGRRTAAGLPAPRSRPRGTAGSFRALSASVRNEEAFGRTAGHRMRGDGVVQGEWSAIAHGHLPGRDDVPQSLRGDAGTEARDGGQESGPCRAGAALAAWADPVSPASMYPSSRDFARAIARTSSPNSGLARTSAAE